MDMLCQIDPSYKKLIRYQTRNTKTLYGKVKKAIYGTLLGAVLFYNKLKGILIEMGFEMNEHEECTFNKMVNGKQCTIQFRVDDLKLSHVEQGVLDDGIIDKLDDIFGSDGGKLAASYGYVHEYHLGMTIDLSEVGRVVFTMYDYLEDTIANAPDCFDGEDVTPVISTLFQVDINHSINSKRMTLIIFTGRWLDFCMLPNKLDRIYKWLYRSFASELRTLIRVIGRNFEGLSGMCKVQYTCH